MWDFVDKFGTLIGIVSAAIAAWSSWNLRRETIRQREKENEQISVILRSNELNEEIKLPIQLRRGNLTRAELLGLIGMLPMIEKGKRFEIIFLNTHEFSQQLAAIRDSDEEFEFIVKCSADELKQFEYDLISIV